MGKRLVEQAGVVAFRRGTSSPEILIIRAKKNPQHWIFPKGHIEPGEQPWAAALREAREEAGVLGRIVCRLCPALRFRSGAERVRVQYYLVECTGQDPVHEEREHQWLPSHEATTVLTHDDANTLLAGALRAIGQLEQLMSTSLPDDFRPAKAAFVELALAEYAHMGESLIRNEEDGEKRASFFLTFATGAGAALGYIANAAPAAGSPATHLLVISALAVMFVVGYLTLRRVVARNKASDGYKQALHKLRRHFLDGPDDPRVAVLAFDPFRPRDRPLPSWRSVGKGGWLETIAFAESVIAGALAATTVTLAQALQSPAVDGPGAVNGLAVGLGGLAVIACWVLLMRHARTLCAAANEC